MQSLHSRELLNVFTIQINIVDRGGEQTFPVVLVKAIAPIRSDQFGWFGSHRLAQ